MCRSESTFSSKMRKIIPHCCWTCIIWKLIVNILWSHCRFLGPLSLSLGVSNTFLPKSTGPAISQGPEEGTRGGEGQPVPAEGTAEACGCEAARSDNSNTFGVTGSRVCEKSEPNRPTQKEMQNCVIRDVSERGETGPSHRLF